MHLRVSYGDSTQPAKAVLSTERKGEEEAPTRQELFPFLSPVSPTSSKAISFPYTVHANVLEASWALSNKVTTPISNLTFLV